MYSKTMKCFKILVTSILIAKICFFSPLASGQTEVQQKQQSLAQSSAEAVSPELQRPLPKEKHAVTHHSITINGEIIHYTATAGLIPLTDKSGEKKASIFFVAYTRDGVEDPSKRPITFAFNGGPGASSIWLHFGALGPRRVPVAHGDSPVPPPYKVVDNEYSWIDLTDLVFIDPVGTGYSRSAQKQEPKQFYAVESDIQSVGDFIRLYVTQYQRWMSPKFIAGESYGTVRAVLLASHLHDTLGMDINGLVLISAVLNFQTFSFNAGNDLPYVMFLPTYAATASYHKKLSPELQSDLQKTVKEVEHWALNDYLAALAKGDALQGSEKNEIVEKLSRYTGVPKSYIERKRLRIRRSDFRRELLRTENLTVGILDSRYTITTPSDENFFDDPDIVATVGPYVAALNDYLRDKLKYDSDLPYVFLSQEANRSWNWGSAAQGYLNVSGKLRDIISKLKYLKVLIASGYYDLDAPYFATVYNVNHVGLDPSLRKNFKLAFYEAGHQMYTDLPSLKKLKADISDFMKGALP
jgi:carboxypeptidase C (cathepsin A)